MMFHVTCPGVELELLQKAPSRPHSKAPSLGLRTSAGGRDERKERAGPTSPLGGLLEKELGVAGGSVSHSGGGPTGDLMIPKRSEWSGACCEGQCQSFFKKKYIPGR